MTGVEAFDLLVVGGGMAGMAAAAQAAELGARVAVCEVADQLGGTALLSSGNVWTVDTAEAFRTADPDGDLSLWSAVRAGLFDSLEWVASLGVTVGERHQASSSSMYDPPPIGKNIDIESFIERSSRMVESAGGWILRGTTVERLIIDEGAVVGAVLVDRTGTDRLEVATRAAVMSTGGFQSSPQLVDQYFGPGIAGAVVVRSNPMSAGGGLNLALKVGAACTESMDRFYGVVLAAVDGDITESDFRALVLHFAVVGVALGKAGHRLVDESAGAVGIANAVARQGRAVLVFGPGMLDEAAQRLGIDAADCLAVAAARGARVAGPVGRRTLADVVTSWGYDGPGALNAISEFDDSVDSDANFTVPRARYRIPVGHEGLVAVEVKAAMTSTYGGIRTNVDGQALRPDGTVIAGLFAAGVDQGGYNVSGYAGGLARALVFGRRAALCAMSSPTAGRGEQ